MSRTSDLDGETWNSYPTHMNDKNETRRAYNRLVTARNIYENHGDVLTGLYMEQFEETDKRQMALIGAIIKVKGLDYLRQEINRLTANEE